VLHRGDPLVVIIDFSLENLDSLILSIKSPFLSISVVSKLLNLLVASATLINSFPDHILIIVILLLQTHVPLILDIGLLPQLLELIGGPLDLSINSPDIVKQPDLLLLYIFILIFK